jgi:hypothetical protein
VVCARLLMVCAGLRRFAQRLSLRRFTQGLRKVYARFTQGLRRFKQSSFFCHLRKPGGGLRRFTHGLRRFTHIVHKPKKVYAWFTQVYAGLRRLRTGQLADEHKNLILHLTQHFR